MQQERLVIGSHWHHRLRVWGPNLVRNSVEAPKTQVIAVADKNTERLCPSAAAIPE